MKTVFIDTSAFYALFNREDPHHDEVVSCYGEGSIFLVTTDAVFTELMSLLTKRQGKAIAIRCGRAMKEARDRLSIVRTEEVQAEKAWQLFCKFRDKDYDLVDCLSFVFMEERGIEEALAFDRHFTQYGFRIVSF